MKRLNLLLRSAVILGLAGVVLQSAEAQTPTQVAVERAHLLPAAGSRSRRIGAVAVAAEIAYPRQHDHDHRTSRRRGWGHAGLRVSRPGRARCAAHSQPRRIRAECNLEQFLGSAGPGTQQRAARGGSLLRRAAILFDRRRLRLLQDPRRGAQTVGLRSRALRRCSRGAHGPAAGHDFSLHWQRD